jgi:hypothetical protein
MFCVICSIKLDDGGAFCARCCSRVAQNVQPYVNNPVAVSPVAGQMGQAASERPYYQVQPLPRQGQHYYQAPPLVKYEKKPAFLIFGIIGLVAAIWVIVAMAILTRQEGRLNGEYSKRGQCGKTG